MGVRESVSLSVGPSESPKKTTPKITEFYAPSEESSSQCPNVPEKSDPLLKPKTDPPPSPSKPAPQQQLKRKLDDTSDDAAGLDKNAKKRRKKREMENAK